MLPGHTWQEMLDVIAVNNGIKKEHIQLIREGTNTIQKDVNRLDSTGSTISTHPKFLPFYAMRGASWCITF